MKSEKNYLNGRSILGLTCSGKIVVVVVRVVVTTGLLDLGRFGFTLDFNSIKLFQKNKKNYNINVAI